MYDSLLFQAMLGVQLLYVASGVAYNLVSLRRGARGKPALAPTNPRTGLAFMAALVVPIAVGWAGFSLVFAVLWLLLGPVIVMGGVLPHARALAAGGDALERYASRESCQVALAVNLFGIATIVAGLILVLL